MVVSCVAHEGEKPRAHPHNLVSPRFLSYRKFYQTIKNSGQPCGCRSWGLQEGRLHHECAVRTGSERRHDGGVPTPWDPMRQKERRCWCFEAEGADQSGSVPSGLWSHEQSTGSRPECCQTLFPGVYNLLQNNQSGDLFSTWSCMSQLCWQVFLENSNSPGKYTVPLPPVCSKPIFDAKAKKTLQVCSKPICDASGMLKTYIWCNGQEKTSGTKTSSFWGPKMLSVIRSWIFPRRLPLLKEERKSSSSVKEWQGMTLRLRNPLFRGGTQILA